MQPRLGRVPDRERRFALVQHSAVEQTAHLPAQVTYAPLLGARPNQTTYGCCVSESATEIMQAEMLRHAPGGMVPLSVSANYAQAQRNVNPGQEPQDNGLPTGAGLGTYQRDGYVLDSVRPFPPANDESAMLRAVPAYIWQPKFENFYPLCRKTPGFSPGDIRHPPTVLDATWFPWYGSSE